VTIDHPRRCTSDRRRKGSLYALSTRIKPFVYVSTIGVGDGITPGTFVEQADVRQMSATPHLDYRIARKIAQARRGSPVCVGHPERPQRCGFRSFFFGVFAALFSCCALPAAADDGQS
jgi:hypothetical protein